MAGVSDSWGGTRAVLESLGRRIGPFNDGMECVGMGRDEFERIVIGQDGMGCVGMGWDVLGWDGTRSNG